MNNSQEHNQWFNLKKFWDFGLLNEEQISCVMKIYMKNIMLEAKINNIEKMI